MKKLIFTIILVLLASCPQMTVSAKKIFMDVDGAVFRHKDNKVLWELYYSFKDTIFKYVPKSGHYLGELYFSVTIESIYKVESFTEWVVTNYIDQPAGAANSKLLGQKDFLLDPGQYKITVNVYDVADTTARAMTIFTLIARQFPTNTLSTSDIELAHAIESQEDTTSSWEKMFLKSTLYVIPNPSGEFYGPFTVIKSYTEIYNCRKVTPDGYDVVYKVFDGAKNEQLEVRKSCKSDGDGLVDIVSIPADSLPTGVYYLKVYVISRTEGFIDTAMAQKKFYILNPLIPPRPFTQFTENELFEKSEFSSMSEDKVAQEYDMAKIIATSYERDTYDKLTSTKAKQRFLFRFWSLRDPDTTTFVNEKLVEYRKTIDYANTYFIYGKSKDGWRTDRGRILLKYGFPTQRDKFPQEGMLKPYESWFYSDQQGGINFYFVDIYGYGNYILVHSTCTGETYNENWYDQYVNSSNVDPNRKLLDVNRQRR